MPQSLHPAAPRDLPSFITAPGETDVLMVVVSIIAVFAILMFGVLYLRLHSLPDQMAHKKIQFEIVCVLGLISMFTHMHIFWIAGLLLALIDLPDFGSSLGRIAKSTERMADVKASDGAAQTHQESTDEVQQSNQAAGLPLRSRRATKKSEDAHLSTNLAARRG